MTGYWLYFFRDLKFCSLLLFIIISILSRLIELKFKKNWVVRSFTLWLFFFYLFKMCNFVARFLEFFAHYIQCQYKKLKSKNNNIRIYLSIKKTDRKIKSISWFCATINNMIGNKRNKYILNEQKPIELTPVKLSKIEMKTQKMLAKIYNFCLWKNK